ncbi:MAG: hypothetical protein KAJ86_06710 [Alphaproteobacteria bacterium]|nr:hypothetical protein [Alphaproteobacteria bacterium]
MSKKEPKIELKHGSSNNILPSDFFEILNQRFFPVLSLTYISSVLGVAAKKGDFIQYLFYERDAYIMALFVSLWVSVPSVLWIILRGSHLFNHVADDWYKIVACIMTVVLLLSFILFPEMNIFGLRTYFVATIPVLFIMYLFFVKGGLPPVAAYPLSAVGFTFLIYGATLNFLY